MQDGAAGGPADVPSVHETYEIVRGEAAAGVRHRAAGTVVPILLCDHAGNAFPPGYGTLGLPPAQIERHIAYDIGAAAVVRGMLARLGGAGLAGTAVLSRYSRLLIDLNRGADDPTLVMRLSDGAIVPGNHPIEPVEWDRRIERYYRPYHRAVDGVIDRILAQGQIPVVVSVHSFTDAWKGIPRPWHVGILWDRDGRLPSRYLAALRAEPGLVVGDNQPYSGQLVGDCLYQHATARVLAHALVEIRQDLITQPPGQQAWADRLARLLAVMLADAGTVADLRPSAFRSHMDPARSSGPHATATLQV